MHLITFVSAVVKEGYILSTAWILFHTFSIVCGALTCLTFVLRLQATFSVNTFNRGAFHGTAHIQKQLDAGMTTEFGYTWREEYG